MAADQKSDTSLVAARGERPSRIGAPSQSAQSPDLTSPSDHLNQQIVRMLEEDGRRPFNEIAAALNVSEGTIRNRVHGMRQAGQIRIVAIADPGAVKYKTDAIICIKVSPTATPAQVAERLARLDEVVYILWVSGRFDLLVEIVSDDPDGLTQFLQNHIHNQSDIAETETMTGLQNFKNQFLLKQNWR
ncbi:MAG: Lrp/AsnC family transcriptional regulator [Pseudomonadota bacterium]